MSLADPPRLFAVEVFMPISYPEILQYKKEGVRRSWTDIEPILYALGTGMGEDPLDPRELPFIYERDLRVMPTFLTVIARSGDPGPLPLNRALVLDGGRDLTVYRPLRGEADVILDGRIVSVIDKGPGRGAILRREVDINDAATGDKIATLATDILARGDGGFGGPSEAGEAKPVRPQTDPDHSVMIMTRANQAALYRLSGDRNALHIDPVAAVKAGFDRPILHGLCTYGLCCRALLQTYADYDPTAIRRIAGRFSGVVLPGETVTIDLWRKGSHIYFEARIKERGGLVIDGGQALVP